MDYNYYHLWNSSFNVNLIEQDNYQKFIIFAAEEAEVNPSWHHLPNFEKLIFKDIDIVFGSADLNTYKSKKSIPNNARIYLWPTFWCNRTYYEFIKNPKVVDQSNITELYISLNNKAHYHRCLLIDKLHYNKLLEHGKVSWHELDSREPYTWTSWTPQYMFLDPLYHEILDSYRTFPEEFNTTLLSVVAESTTSTVFITEKTWTPILFEKPFLVLGGKGFHATLKNLGFQLYDELFDYSFDQFNTESERIDGIISNLKNLVGKDYNYLRSTIKDKAQFNRNKAIEIVQSKSYIPKIVQEHILLLKTMDTVSGNDTAYLEIDKNLKG